MLQPHVPYRFRHPDGASLAGERTAKTHKAKAEEAGLRLPYDCRSGTCTTRIRKGLNGEMDRKLAFDISDVS